MTAQECWCAASGSTVGMIAVGCRKEGEMMNAKKAEDTIDLYFLEGERMACELGNRGPIRFNDDGTLDKAILDAYWLYGFYVLEGVLSDNELKDLKADLESVLERAPHTKNAKVDAKGRKVLGAELALPTFHFARPLSDPVGGTSKHGGRHQARMTEPEPPTDAPDFVISSIDGPLQIMDACLRLYGHPQLMSIAEQINGPDFTPFAESIIVKLPGLGTSVAWHQDGTRLWDNPDWDQGAHGFNFMAQLFGSTAANGVWLLPGSHKQGKHDIRAMIEANDGSDRLPGVVPILCQPGDVAMTNRQTLHGSFANTSPDKRVTFNFGFHRRASVLNVRTKFRDREVVYDEERIRERSRLIALGIDARQQRFPQEPRYIYQPLVRREDANRWNEESRESILKDYNLWDLGI